MNWMANLWAMAMEKKMEELEWMKGALAKIEEKHIIAIAYIEITFANIFSS